MQIELLEVGRASKKDKYFILPIKYKDLGNGKEFDRKRYSCNSDAYKALKGASVGDIYSVDLKKDDNGYWQWENVEKDDVADAPQSKAKSTTEAKVGTVRSTYETPEERAKRQLYITRQWAVNASIEYHKLIGGETSMTDVLDTAKVFEQHVQRVSSVDFTDDKPWENDENGN